MKLNISTMLAVAAICVTPRGFAVAADSCVEVSDDGLESVVLKETGAPTGWKARDTTVPYDLIPDWSVEMRRQVGGLQTADMNGDGLIDLVVGCYISNSYPPYPHWYNYIFYNTGGQLEAEPSWISTDEVSTGDVQVAFINDDPYPDVFAANGGFAMSLSTIYFGTEDGPSMTPGWYSDEPVACWTNYAKPFDIDHDGDMDVVTANQAPSPDPYRPIYVFPNNDGVLSTTPSWQSAELSIQNFLAFADMDGDGWEDLAVSKWSNFESGVYRNLNGTLQTTPVWTTGDDDSDKGVAWADVDGNGDPDLALGHDPTRLYSNDHGVLTLSWSSGASYFGHSDLRFCDVDGDGDQDLAETHFSNGQTHIYLNNDGVLDTSPSWTYDSDVVGTAIAFGDITGNGRPDLIVGLSGDIPILVFYADDFECPADVNGSGVVDIDDLFDVLSHWGEGAGTYDINNDGVVDIDDVFAILADWGPCA
ncbi:MAG: VCBS repeat-containing protein [Phycisphaerales bacterium]|nr:MAG: VCBS repeat-containing protein [Phycisphaerales bacterium]